MINSNQKILFIVIDMNCEFPKKKGCFGLRRSKYTPIQVPSHYLEFLVKFRKKVQEMIKRNGPI